MTTVRVARRFRGPPDSGNGGYCCGLLAGDVTSARVTLRSPPPLDVDLARESSGEGVVLRHGEQLIGEAVPTSLSLDVPAAVSFEAAAAARAGYAAKTEHIYPGCVVCGITRDDDGLNLHPGPVAGTDVVACDWRPDETLPNQGDRVAPEIAWAALDCPSYFGLRHTEKPVLLGRLEAELGSLPMVGEACVVIGWGIERDGRKLFGGSALYGENGSLHGFARATWIELR
ncbi:MAG: hypothetical protein AAGE52_40525 [Myxococcota bacterium]